MEHRLINFVLLLNLIICIYSLIQNWNLENSSIDLLASDSSVSVKVLEETKNKMYVKLTKKIVKQNGSFLYTKHLIISNSVTSTTIFDGQVDFDDIESFHYFENELFPQIKTLPSSETTAACSFMVETCLRTIFLDMKYVPIFGS